jgi:hypothetical protein
MYAIGVLPDGAVVAVADVFGLPIANTGTPLGFDTLCDTETVPLPDNLAVPTARPVVAGMVTVCGTLVDSVAPVVLTAGKAEPGEPWPPQAAMATAVMAMNSPSK